MRPTARPAPSRAPCSSPTCCSLHTASSPCCCSSYHALHCSSKCSPSATSSAATVRSVASTACFTAESCLPRLPARGSAERSWLSFPPNYAFCTNTAAASRGRQTSDSRGVALTDSRHSSTRNSSRSSRQLETETSSSYDTCLWGALCCFLTRWPPATAPFFFFKYCNATAYLNLSNYTPVNADY